VKTPRHRRYDEDRAENRRQIWETLGFVLVVFLVFFLGFVMGGVYKDAAHANNKKCANGKTEFLLKNHDNSSEWYPTDHVCATKENYKNGGK
jgi:hypothetical protein